MPAVAVEKRHVLDTLFAAGRGDPISQSEVKAVLADSIRAAGDALNNSASGLSVFSELALSEVLLDSKSCKSANLISSSYEILSFRICQQLLSSAAYLKMARDASLFSESDRREYGSRAVQGIEEAIRRTQSAPSTLRAQLADPLQSNRNYYLNASLLHYLLAVTGTQEARFYRAALAGLHELPYTVPNAGAMVSMAFKDDGHLISPGASPILVIDALRPFLQGNDRVLGVASEFSSNKTEGDVDLMIYIEKQRTPMLAPGLHLIEVKHLQHAGKLLMGNVQPQLVKAQKQLRRATAAVKRMELPENIKVHRGIVLLDDLPTPQPISYAPYGDANVICIHYNPLPRSFPLPNSDQILALLAPRRPMNRVLKGLPRNGVTG